VKPGTKPWTGDEDDALTQEVADGTPIDEIAGKIGRTRSAIRSRAYVLRLKFGRANAARMVPVLLLLFTPPAFGGVPELNVEAICTARSVDAKMVQSPPDQSTADCVRDEEAAKQELGTLWTSTLVSIRKQCESDARSLHTTSYLDLLACIQIAEDMKSGPKMETEKQ
jgi:hypothetical protein